MSADLVWPLLGEVKAKYLLLEGANPRHRMDVKCFETAVTKGYFKSHQVHGGNGKGLPDTDEFKRVYHQISIVVLRVST